MASKLGKLFAKLGANKNEKDTGFGKQTVSSSESTGGSEKKIDNHTSCSDDHSMNSNVMNTIFTEAVSIVCHNAIIDSHQKSTDIGNSINMANGVASKTRTSTSHPISNIAANLKQENEEEKPVLDAIELKNQRTSYVCKDHKDNICPYFSSKSAHRSSSLSKLEITDGNVVSTAISGIQQITENENATHGIGLSEMDILNNSSLGNIRKQHHSDEAQKTYTQLPHGIATLNVREDSYTLERHRSAAEMSDKVSSNTPYSASRPSSVFHGSGMYYNGIFGGTNSTGNTPINSSTTGPKKFKCMVGTRKSTTSSISPSSSVSSMDNIISPCTTPRSQNTQKSIDNGTLTYYSSSPENKLRKSSTTSSSMFVAENPIDDLVDISNNEFFVYKDIYREGVDDVTIGNTSDLSRVNNSVRNTVMNSSHLNNHYNCEMKSNETRNGEGSRSSSTLCGTDESDSNGENNSKTPAENSASLQKSSLKEKNCIETNISCESATSVRTIDTLGYDESVFGLSPKPNRSVSPNPQNSNYKRKNSPSLGFRCTVPVPGSSGISGHTDDRRECPEVSCVSCSTGISMDVASSENSVTDSIDLLDIRESSHHYSTASMRSSVEEWDISGRVKETSAQKSERENHREPLNFLEVLLNNRKTVKFSKGPQKYHHIFDENIQLLPRQFNELGYLLPKDIMAATISAQTTEESDSESLDPVTKEELNETAFLRLPLKYFCSGDESGDKGKSKTKNIISDAVSMLNQSDNFKSNEGPTKVIGVSNNIYSVEAEHNRETDESAEKIGSYSFYQHYMHKTMPNSVSTPQRTPRRSLSNNSCESEKPISPANRCINDNPAPCMMFEVIEVNNCISDGPDNATQDCAAEDCVRVTIDYNDEEQEEFCDIQEGILATEQLSTLSTSFSHAPLSYTTPSDQDVKLPGNKNTNSEKNEDSSTEQSNEHEHVEKEGTSSGSTRLDCSLIEEIKPPHLTAIDIASYNGIFFCVIGDIHGRVEVLEGNEGHNWREKGRASHQIFFQKLKDRMKTSKSTTNMASDPSFYTDDDAHQFSSQNTSKITNSFDHEEPRNTEPMHRSHAQGIDRPHVKPRRIGNLFFRAVTEIHKDPTVNLTSEETLGDKSPKNSNIGSCSSSNEMTNTPSSSFKGEYPESIMVFKSNYHSERTSSRPQSESDRQAIYFGTELGLNENQTKETRNTSLLHQRCTHQAFVGAFDCLKSVTIDQQLRCIKILPPNRSPGVVSYLAANEKSIKLFRIRSDHSSAEGSEIGFGGVSRSNWCSNDSYILGLKNLGGGGVGGRRIVMPVKAFTNAHQFQIQSLSLSADCETFLSLDDFQIYWWHIEAADTTKATLLENIKPIGEDIDTLLSTAAFHGTNNSLFLVGKSNGVCDVGDLRHPPCRSKRQYVTSFVVKPRCHNAVQHPCHNDILSAVSSAAFMGDNYVVTRDYLTMKLWDMRNSSAPAASCPVMGYVAQCIDSLYDSDSIFDRFPLAVDDTSMSVVTGLYNGTVAVWRPGRGAYKNTQLPHTDYDNNEPCDNSPSYEDRDEDEGITLAKENESRTAKRIFPSRTYASDTLSSLTSSYSSKTLKDYTTAIMSVADPYDEVEFYCGYPGKLEPKTAMQNETWNFSTRGKRPSGYCSLSQVTESTIVNSKECDTEYNELTMESTLQHKCQETVQNEYDVDVQRSYPRITDSSQKDRVVNVSVSPGGERFAFTTNEHLFLFNCTDN